MAIKLKELEGFFKNKKLGKEPFRLDQCSVIEDQKQFVESHLSVLRANTGNKVAMPYYHRLVKFYKIIKDKHNGAI